MPNYGMFTKDMRFESVNDCRCFDLDILATGLKRPYNRLVVYRQSYSAHVQQPKEPFVVVPGFLKRRAKEGDINSEIGKKWNQYVVIRIDELLGQELGMSPEDLYQRMEELI